MSRKTKRNKKKKKAQTNMTNILEVICNNCGLIFEWDINNSGTCPDCIKEEREILAIYQINEMAIKENQDYQGKITYVSCPFCNLTYNQDIDNCPQCYVSGSSLKIPSFGDILNHDECDILAREAWKLSYTHHSIISFTAHYMVLNHFIWTFIDDMIRGVIPNKRIEAKKKMEYVNNFFGYLDAEGSVFIDTLEEIPDRNFLSLHKYLIIISDETSEMSQINPRLYYNALENDEATTTRILGKLIWIHVNIQAVLETFLNDIEFEQDKQTDSQKFEKVTNIVKQFHQLKLY